MLFFRMPRTGLKIFFDGGCRPNHGAMPGLGMMPSLGMMEVAAVTRGELFHRPALGHGSSHHAEWLALLHALRIGRQLGETDLLLLGDALAVVDQANGKTKCRGRGLQACLSAFEEEARHFARVRVRYIKRTQNLAGIDLARIRERSGPGSQAPSFPDIPASADLV